MSEVLDVKLAGRGVIIAPPFIGLPLLALAFLELACGRAKPPGGQTGLDGGGLDAGSGGTSVVATGGVGGLGGGFVASGGVGGLGGSEGLGGAGGVGGSRAAGGAGGFGGVGAAVGAGGFGCYFGIRPTTTPVLTGTGIRSAVGTVEGVVDVVATSVDTSQGQIVLTQTGGSATFTLSLWPLPTNLIGVGEALTLRYWSRIMGPTGPGFEDAFGASLSRGGALVAFAGAASTGPALALSLPEIDPAIEIADGGELCTTVRSSATAECFASVHLLRVTYDGQMATIRPEDSQAAGSLQVTVDAYVANTTTPSTCDSGGRFSVSGFVVPPGGVGGVGGRGPGGVGGMGGG